MKTLQKQIKINGFDHTQLLRDGNRALYMKTKGDYVGFEVINIQSAKSDYTFPNGHEVSKGDESYPSHSKWGMHGWSFTSLHAATSFYKEATNEQK